MERKVVMKKIGIVGKGLIGRRLRERLEEAGYKIAFFLGRQAAEDFPGLLVRRDPGVVFVAISTLDHGEAARDYILACVQAEIPVITAEKGALAYHAMALKEHLSRIGFSAAVGGGTLMLQYARSRNLVGFACPVEIQGVFNGTSNFILDEMSRGRGLGEACAEASRLGYAEPGASSPLELINGELGDVVRKCCVFFNTTLAGPLDSLTPERLGSFVFGPEGLEKLARQGGNHRLIVSFSRSRKKPREKVVGTGVSATLGGWQISAGFRQISPADAIWLPGGVGNALHIVEGELGSGGKYTLSGPGAGAEPTTSAMLNDFENLTG